MTIGFQIFWPPRPDVAASYALRVPQTGDLPSASSRPHLTMIALAVQLTVPVIRVRRGLAPSSECALPGALKKGKGGYPFPFPLVISDICILSGNRNLVLPLPVGPYLSYSFYIRQEGV